MTAEPRPLTEAQLLLLQLFSRELRPEDMRRLKQLLADFYDDLVQLEIQQLEAQGKISQEKLDALQIHHPTRTPYRP